LSEEKKGEGVPSRRGYLKTVGAGIVGLAVGAAIGYGAAPKAAPGAVTTVTKTETVTATAPGVGLPPTITFGVIAELTGDYAVAGIEDRDAILIAIDDINAYLKSIGVPTRFDVVIEDTKSTPEGALKACQTVFEAKGVQVILGPGTSREVAAIKSYVDEHKIVDLPISSSPSLSVPDYIFRFIGPDTAQSVALAKLAINQGFKKVAVMYRGDLYGDALAKLFIKNFEAEGGKTAEVRYTPDLPDYSSEVGVLSSKVSELGVDKETAVLIISFETDGYNILSHASRDPILTKVRWLGAEIVRSPTFLPPTGTKEVAEFLIATKIMGTYFVPGVTPLTKDLVEKFKKKTGHEPRYFAYQTYDKTWVAALTVLTTGKYDGETIKNALPEIAAHFAGTSGQCLLDENGDRATQDYGIWTVVKEDGEYKFKDIGVYNSSSQSFTWY